MISRLWFWVFMCVCVFFACWICSPAATPSAPAPPPPVRCRAFPQAVPCRCGGDGDAVGSAQWRREKDRNGSFESLCQSHCICFYFLPLLALHLFLRPSRGVGPRRDGRPPAPCLPHLIPNASRSFCFFRPFLPLRADSLLPKERPTTAQTARIAHPAAVQIDPYTRARGRTHALRRSQAQPNPCTAAPPPPSQPGRRRPRRKGCPWATPRRPLRPGPRPQTRPAPPRRPRPV